LKGRKGRRGKEEEGRPEKDISPFFGPKYKWKGHFLKTPMI